MASNCRALGLSFGWSYGKVGNTLMTLSNRDLFILLSGALLGYVVERGLSALEQLIFAGM